MRTVGVVGRIGCGKTALCRILAERHGCEVIEADRIGHEALKDRRLRAAIASRFGPGVIGPDGGIDRGALARIAFEDEEALEALNARIHPWIVDRINRRLAALRATGAAGIVLIDAALLLDWGDALRCDAVVLVRCSEEVSVARLRDRGLTGEQARLRLGMQDSEEELRRRADFVVDNEGDLEQLAREAARLWTWLQRREERESP